MAALRGEMALKEPKMRAGTDRGDAKRCVIPWEGNSEVSCISGGKASLYVRLLAHSQA